jgi:hypothetical protein
VTKFVVPQAKAKEKQVYKADTCSISTHERKKKGHQVHHFIVSEQTKANDDCHNFF